MALDITEAPRLAQVLALWPWTIDDVRSLVGLAETLCELSVGVDPQLEEIASTGRTLSMSIYTAVDIALGYELRLAPLALHQITVMSNATDSTHATDAQVDEIEALLGLIERTHAAGRDASAAFIELLSLGVSSSALSFLLQGGDTHEVLTHFSNGEDAAFGRVANAMTQGLSPAQAEIPPLFFPADYVAWHAAAAEIAELEASIEVTESTLAAIERGDVAADPQTHAELAAVLNQLPTEQMPPHLVASFLLLLAGDIKLEDLPRNDQSVVVSLVDDRSEAAQSALDELLSTQAMLAIPTFDGMTPIRASGAVSAFDAIGSAAVMVPNIPSEFVGTSYAMDPLTLSLDELTRASEFLATDGQAATSFFDQLGAEATGTFLADLNIRGNGTIDPGQLVDGEIAVNLSQALGLASDDLPTDFAVGVITSRPDAAVMFDFELGPEYLFAHGEFAPDFLVAAAATSLTVNENRTPLAVNAVRAPIVDAVDRAGLGADLVVALDAHDAVGALLFMPASVAATSGLIRQAGGDQAASQALLASAATVDELDDLDQAEALSAVLAMNVAEYIGAPADSVFFDVAEMVFAVGKGFELDAAVRAHLVQITTDGFAIGDTASEGTPWRDDLNQAGIFSAHIDASKYLALQANAAALDAAAQDRADRINGAFTLASIGVTVAGVFTYPTLMAVTGVGVSGAGWLTPMFSAPPDNLEQFYLSTIAPAMSFDQRGEAIVLWSALVAGAIETPADITLDLSAVQSDIPVISVTNANGRYIQIAVTDNGQWASQLLDVLPADETVVHVSEDESMRLQDALNTVGDALLSNDYVYAFTASTGLTGR